MGLLDSLFSGGGSNLVDSVGNLLTKINAPKEEQLQQELEIVKADTQFQVDMKKLSNDEQQMIYQDISSARTMSTALQTSPDATKLSKNTTPYLAIGTTLLTFTLFFMLIFYNNYLINSGSKEIVLYILGVMSAILTQIYSFYFGSSQGSSDKNKIIENMHNNSISNP
jgi:hypothetical protein